MGGMITLPDTAGDFLGRLPASDVIVWTDGSVFSPLDVEDVRVNAACRRCLSSSSLFYLSGLISFSFSDESIALIHCLEWCHYHLKTCHFQSTLFLTDSQLALAFLSTDPAFLQPKSFWDNWDLSDSSPLL